MSTLDEITKEKQRISEALARVDAQRDKLTEQLSELEATERVLARYTKGMPPGRGASAKTTATKRALQRDQVGASGRQPQKQLAGSAVHRALMTRSLPWQPAKRSKKLPPRARELARTMSVPPLPGTSGPGA
jgi:hypothetical protein